MRQANALWKWKRMALLMGTVTALAVFLFVSSYAADPRLSPGKQLKAVEGVNVRGNKATLKKGYQFKKIGSNQVRVYRARGGTGLRGAITLECSCNEKSGCRMVVEENTAWCEPVSCDKGCSFKAIMQGKGGRMGY